MLYMLYMLCVVPMMRTKSKERGGAAQWVSTSGQYGAGHLPQRGQDTAIYPMELPHHSGESCPSLASGSELT